LFPFWLWSRIPAQKVRNSQRHQENQSSSGTSESVDRNPDGALYVSNLGFGLPADGEGQVLKITLPD
jgi:hypothetical protein